MVPALVIGACVGLGARAALRRALLVKFRRDVRRLNAGEHEPLLAGYAEQAELRFDTGPHRWSGHHRGRAAIGRFLAEFAAAGLQGEIVELWMGGPPWALELVARFDDRATDPDGAELYRNRVVMVVRTRWGRIVHQEDFFEDTRRIDQLEAGLQRLGITPVAADASTGPA